MAAQRPWAAWIDDEGQATAVVQVTRELAAPPEQVFRAWTDPDLFTRWFRPPGVSSLRAELDVRPGGRYRIALDRREVLPGTTYLGGTYLEVSPPERLVFTWAWEDAPPLEDLEDLEDAESRVTVRFQPRNGSTELSITHERLASVDLRAFHRWGWSETTARLAELLEPG